MTREIAVAVFKGGVGKTTTAVNLSAALAAVGRRVLLIDTDTQGQAAAALGMNPARGLADLVAGDVTVNKAVAEARPGLFLLAGGPSLAGVKMEISRRPYGGERALFDITRPFVRRFDYVIWDTGPGFDALSINVLFATREIIAPVSLEPLAVNGLVMFTKQLEDIRQHHDTSIRYIVPTALDRRVSQSGEIVDQIRQHFGDRVCDPIRYNVRLSEAPAHGKHIFEYAIDSNGAADYARLAERILSDE